MSETIALKERAVQPSIDPYIDRGDSWILRASKLQKDLEDTRFQKMEDILSAYSRK